MGRTLFAILMLPLIGLAACGQSDDSPKATTGTSSNGTQSMTVTDGKGTKVSVAGTGASASMPAFAPLFPGAAVESTTTMPQKGGMVMFKTGATQQAVIDYYRKSAAAAGLKDTFNMTTGDSVSYGATGNKPERSLSVTASKGEEGTQVQVVWN